MESFVKTLNAKYDFIPVLLSNILLNKLPQFSQGVRHFADFKPQNVSDYELICRSLTRSQILVVKNRILDLSPEEAPPYYTAEITLNQTLSGYHNSTHETFIYV